jgi:hypothetical protein
MKLEQDTCPRCGAVPPVHRRSCARCALPYELVDQHVVWALDGEPMLTEPTFDHLDNPEGPQG